MQPCAVQSGSWSSAKEQCANDPAGFKPGSPSDGDKCAGGVDATYLTDGTIRARSFVNTGPVTLTLTARSYVHTGPVTLY